MPPSFVALLRLHLGNKHFVYNVNHAIAGSDVYAGYLIVGHHQV